MTGAARTKPIEDVQDISAITYGFMASKALFSALEFDMFTRIAEGANSTSALAKATGIAENRLLSLLASLKSLGLLSEVDGRLVNAPATSRYLVAGAPGDFRDYVQFVNGAFGYESFRHLGAALRGERVFLDKGFYEGLVYEGGIGGERFSSAQHRGSLGPARLMAKRLDLKDRLKLLDAGGGSGAYSIAFCNANPQLSATILDFPQTVDTAKRYAREAGLAGRIANIAGNAVTTDLPEGHDVVLMSYLWSAVGESRHRRAGETRRRRSPGGRFAAAARLHGRRRSGRSEIFGLVSDGQRDRQSLCRVPYAGSRGEGHFRASTSRTRSIRSASGAANWARWRSSR